MTEEESYFSKLEKFKLGGQFGPWTYPNDCLWELVYIFDSMSLDDPEIPSRKPIDEEEIE